MAQREKAELEKLERLLQVAGQAAAQGEKAELASLGQGRPKELKPEPVEASEEDEVRTPYGRQQCRRYNEKPVPEG